MGIVIENYYILKINDHFKILILFKEIFFDVDHFKSLFICFMIFLGGDCEACEILAH